MAERVREERFQVPSAVNRVQMIALVVGVVGLILAALSAVLGGAIGLKQFFHAYLTAFLFWTGVTLGSLALLMLQFVARGAWGVTIRRVLEASTKNIPLMFLLFVPILIDNFTTHFLYHWSHLDVPFALNEAGKHPIIQEKSLYLDSGWFVVRFILYFLIYGGLAFFIWRWSKREDETGDIYYSNMMRNISGPGIVVFALTTTFASVDWVMSLDAEWYSTIFGILFLGAWGLSAMSFTIITMVFLSKYEPMRSILSKTLFQDLGKLLLAFVMLWAYFSVSQLLIIWSGNLPEEIPWYLRRMNGGWGAISIAIVLFHFALPFLLLLSRRTKRNTNMLVTIAIGIFIARFIDASWLVMPQLYVDYAQATPNIYVPFYGIELLVALATVIGVGGLWVWFFIFNLKKMPLLPLGDPFLERALTHGHGHH